MRISKFDTVLRSTTIILLVVANLFIGLEADAQCQVCKATLESAGGEGANTYGEGINTGIIYLMAVPYLLLMFFFRKHIFGFLKEFRAMWSN